MVSSWKLSVPKLGEIEFRKVYGTLGQKVYSKPESEYEKVYYCPIHRTKVMEGRSVAYCEKCNIHYPLRKGGDGITPGPGEPGGVIVKYLSKGEQQKTDSGAFSINARVINLVSSSIIPRSSIDTSFQYYLVPIANAENKAKYEILADLLSREGLVAITNPIRISSRSSLKRVFGISADKSKKILVMTKLLEQKYVVTVPDEAKFKRMLIDPQMRQEVNQAKATIYNPSWRY